jgi:hypothetical protein
VVSGLVNRLPPDERATLLGAVSAMAKSADNLNARLPTAGAIEEMTHQQNVAARKFINMADAYRTT